MIVILTALGFLFNDPGFSDPGTIEQSPTTTHEAFFNSKNVGNNPKDQQKLLQPAAPPIKRAYIASYPRCGNKWTRSLIEEATGITTAYSFLGFKQGLMPLYPWEGFVNVNYAQKGLRIPNAWEPLTIKTHFPVYHNPPLGEVENMKVVRLVRHPVDSFYSWYVLSLKGTKRAPAYQIPSYALQKSIPLWRMFQKHWNVHPNVLTIRYEDLFTDPVNTLRLILEHIGYEFTQEDLERAVRKYPPEGSLLKHMKHFTQNDLMLIQRELGELMLEYGYEITQIHKLD